MIRLGCTSFIGLLLLGLSLAWASPSYGQVIINIGTISPPLDFDSDVMEDDYTIVGLETIEIDSVGTSRFHVSLPSGISDLHLSIDAADGRLDPPFGWFTQTLFLDETFSSDGLEVDLEGGELIVNDSYFSVTHNTPFEIRATIPRVIGDVDGDGATNAVDIDLILDEINTGGVNPVFDLTGDAAVNRDDAVELVEGIIGTQFGDANLDFSVDRRDALIVATNLGRSSGAGWSLADFTGEGAVGLIDVSIIQANSGSAMPPSPAAVPEPSSLLLAALAILALVFLNWRSAAVPATAKHEIALPTIAPPHSRTIV